MAFDAIAYAPDQLCLLTIDGAELLAHDVEADAPKWRLAFEQQLVAVLFVDPSALPFGAGGASGSPWRSAASAGRCALALDVEGRVHLVDPARGQALGAYGPFGKPRAIAASTTGASVALAVDDALLVWRSGERFDVPFHASATAKATALAFSRDGATLAAATEKGEVRMFRLAGAPEETFRVDLRGAIASLAQDDRGSWLVVDRDGAVFVGSSGVARLEKLPAGVRRVGFDAKGERVALQHSERGVVVYEWPSLSVTMRIEYTDRPVLGLAFGRAGWLGVALDHGDGNEIDVGTSATRRTDTHPGRTHRSWTLHVAGRVQPQEAKEAAEIEEMKAAFLAPPSASRRMFRLRLRLGVMITVAALALFIGVRMMSAPGTSSDLTPSVVSAPPFDLGCDRPCVEARLSMVVRDCEGSALGCAGDARAAVKAYSTGDCVETRAAVRRIESLVAGRGDGAGAPLLGPNVRLVARGLDTLCATAEVRPSKPTYAQLVTLNSPDLDPVVEWIPSAMPGEEARAVWAAPDGATYIAMSVVPAWQREPSCVVYRKSRSGEWSTVNDGLDGDCAALHGTSATDVYVATSSRLSHFDGERWEPVSTPALDVVYGSISSGADILVAGQREAEARVHRRRRDTWTVEAIPAGLEVTTLFDGPSLWAVALGRDSREVLLQRSATGSWSVRAPARDAGAARVLDLWASATGDTFVATRAGVLRSTRGGPWKTLETPVVVEALWGRSSTDLYGATRRGLLRYDGTTWSETSCVGAVGAVSGTATQVLVVRVGE
ncbi:MAG: hypothetical protein KF894_00035 [Labilithrix sp.]|nr:hypothetical protein [Labilithrix sp.]